MSGELHGFRLPTSQLPASYSLNAWRGVALVYRIVRQGRFADV